MVGAKLKNGINNNYTYQSEYEKLTHKKEFTAGEGSCQFASFRKELHCHNISARASWHLDNLKQKANSGKELFQLIRGKML